VGVEVIVVQRAELATARAQNGFSAKRLYSRRVLFVEFFSTPSHSLNIRVCVRRAKNNKIFNHKIELGFFFLLTIFNVIKNCFFFKFILNHLQSLIKTRDNLIT